LQNIPGVVTVGMFSLFRHWRERRILQRSPVSPAQWQDAFAALPILKGLSAQEQDSLRKLAILFLHHKAIETTQGLVLDQQMKLLIALQACLTILKLGLDCYDGWYSVIVYPAGFAPARVVTDEYGIEHHVQDHLAGESWQQGPVILSWDDTAHAGIIDGHNLVIHEFAHKLDMQNGVANGYPPLHGNMHKDSWVQAFTVGYEDFVARCEHGKHIGIDCYAASSPAEFFAVFSEVFFERPAVIKQYYPAIYMQLCLYYRQDPGMRLP